jgi:hypothetical protein
LIGLVAAATELTPALWRFDPRHEVVVCATAVVDSSQRVIGVGAVDLDEGRPEVAIDDRQDPQLAALLKRTLDGRVRARRRR